jgi:preprotein translocase subunit SecD
MRHKSRFGAALALLPLLVACSPPPVSMTATVVLNDASPAQVAEAAQILQARFSELRPAMNSRVEAQPGPSSVMLSFRGEAPTEETVRSYAGTQGIYRMYPMDSRANLLLTDRDIESVSVTSGDSGPVLNLQVHEPGAQRLLAFTSKGSGKVLVTTWDRDVLNRATVQGAFSSRFQTTGMDRDTAMRVMICLRHGRLPVRVRDIEIRRPAQ